MKATPPAGIRAAKLAKAKRATLPRHETRAGRKRCREEGGICNDLKELSEEQLAGEGLAGDPTESEMDVAPVPARVGQRPPSSSGQAPAKKCAGEKVRYKHAT